MSSEPVAADATQAEAETAHTTAPGATEEYTIVHTGASKLTRRMQKLHVADDGGEKPLIDTTAALPKNSKKNRRMQKAQERRQKKAASKINTFLEFPPELLFEIFSYLRPTDIYRLMRLNHATKDFVLQHEMSIANDIMNRRYFVLHHCFPIPKPLSAVDTAAQTALLHPKRQQATELHKKPYQHILAPSSSELCSCSSCLLAWNDLNLILDLAHFQWNLNHRQPIPMVPRGTTPEWNNDLIQKHAGIVKKAIHSSPLTYAGILQVHLNTITSTLLRQTRFPPHVPVHNHKAKSHLNQHPGLNPADTVRPGKTVHPMRLYNIREKDAEKEDDTFLERPGKPSYEFPFHRDKYYSLLAYVPNRRWVEGDYGDGHWSYYAQGSQAHERDLEFVILQAARLKGS
jgi:hypothetical protein